jgi:hypothetical protein
MGKYFNVTVKPIMRASVQTAGAYGAGDILFDWTSFQIPKGSTRLISTTALVRGTNGADQPAVDMELFFAKSIDGVAPTTLGAGRAAVDTASPIGSVGGWFNNILGHQTFDVSEQGMGVLDDLVFMHTVQSPGNGGSFNLVLTGEENSGDNVGYDTIYVAGIAQGAFTWQATPLMQAACSVNDSFIKLDAGSDDDPNAENIFQAGDVLVSGTDDEIIGTVEQVNAFDTDHQRVVLAGTGALHAAGNNEKVYNQSPITLVFSFEK